MSTQESTRRTTPIPVWSDPGLRFAAGHAVLVALLLAAGLCRLGAEPTEGLVVVAMAVVAAGLPVLMRPVLAVITWAFVTGFVVNGLGTLTFGVGDLKRLVVLIVSITTLGSARRRAG